MKRGRIIKKVTRIRAPVILEKIKLEAMLASGLLPLRLASIVDIFYQLIELLLTE